MEIEKIEEKQIEKKIEKINHKIDMLENACKQKWASKDEIIHWERGIREYQRERDYLLALLSS